MTIVQIRWFGAYNLVNSFSDENIIRYGFGIFRDKLELGLGF